MEIRLNTWKEDEIGFYDRIIVDFGKGQRYMIFENKWATDVDPHEVSYDDGVSYPLKFVGSFKTSVKALAFIKDKIDNGN